MRTVIRFFAMLYPLRWRRRYGAEFDALLDDGGADAGTALNVFTGAISMQMRSWNAGKILAIAAVAGVLAAVGIALSIPKEYSSTSVVKIGAASPDEVGGRVNTMANSVLSKGSLTRTIVQLGLYKRERTRKPIEDVIEQMHRDIRILLVASVGSTTIPAFAVQFTYTDPLLAQRVTQDLTSKFIEMNQQRDGTGRGSMLLEVIDPASLPEHAMYPNTSVMAGVGLFGGLVLGSIVALMVRLRRRKTA